jgi:prepilin-type N-terminal cleavage/methylation domain-containing protein
MMNTVRNKGFTLVEMAIVLVIIGIILAGVMKGRDIVRGAQVKQFSQQFAQKWATIAQTYYDKTGQLLLDGTGNGGAAATPPDGVMDADLAGRVYDTAAASPGVQQVLEAVGITPCTLIKSKMNTPVGMTNLTAPTTGVCNSEVNIVQTTVEGEYTGNQMVQVDLNTLTLTLGGQTIFRNAVILYNVPTDVAQGLDTAIDGKVDGTSGSCIGLGVGYTAGGQAFIASNAAIAATVWSEATGTAAVPRPAQTVGIILDY